MNYNSEFCSGEQFKKFVSKLLKRELTTVEIKLLEGFFDNKTYEEISKSSGYSFDHLKKEGKKLIDDIKEKPELEIYKKTLNKKTFVLTMAEIYRDNQASSESGNTTSVSSELDILYTQAENLNSSTLKNSIALKVVNSTLKQRGKFSKTCYYIEENNGTLSAICMTRDGKPTQANQNLNDEIANMDGNLEWFPKGGYAKSSRKCKIEKLDSNSDVYLECECQRDDGSWKTSRLNLDERIDNEDGKLWCVPLLMTNYS